MPAGMGLMLLGVAPLVAAALGADLHAWPAVVILAAAWCGLAGCWLFVLGLALSLVQVRRGAR
jgi:hypothetical protein